MIEKGKTVVVTDASTLPKTYDPKRVEEALYRTTPEYRLEEFRKKYIGDFNTALHCHCGNEACMIRDLAKPHYAQSLYSGPLRIGQVQEAPLPSKVNHTYYGSECGTLFFAPVIEGKRGYIPREKKKKEDGEGSQRVPYDSPYRESL